MARLEPAQRHRADEEYLANAFQFLVSDFGYVALGPIQVPSPDVEVRGYLNVAAERQVELSGYPIGVTFLGGIRQLRGGVPAPYDRDHWLELTQIAMVRDPRCEELLDFHLNPRGWAGAVDAAARLLRDNPDLLTGRGWIPRVDIFRRWKKHFLRTFGVKLDSDDTSLLNGVRPHFAFLLDLGYVITYDTDTLSPHEYVIPHELRYEKNGHCVTIECVDFREGEWRVTQDGRPIGGVFRLSPDEIASRAAQVAENLGGGRR